MKHQPLLFALLFLLSPVLLFSQEQPPNIILIITDDQGYGDFGFTGNPVVHTPTLDSLAEKSIHFTDFYVSPVCAPTRASLMTGRYSLRTGIRDTYNGGAIMATEEITIAEMLKGNGYRTGIFGKWHLGDSYPSRPMDQGFDESVIHLSGGMGQVGDFTTYFQGDRSYFDPVLWHNGIRESYEGYCSDIFTNEAIGFMNENSENPFFLYLSFNAPHTPLQVPEEYYERYKDTKPQEVFDANNPHGEEMNEKNIEDAKKVYAMVSNIDDNLNALFSALEESGKRDNTVVIFMTDNGPQQRRYVGGMRGRKGSVFRGGVRVPMLMSYPNRFEGSREISKTSVHMDIFPTLANLTGSNIPQDRDIDGQSLVQLIEDGKSLEPRSLFFYWERKYPTLYQNIAIQKGDYRLVAHTGSDADLDQFQLFNYRKDDAEQIKLNEENEVLVKGLKEEMDQKYQELISSINLQEQPPIHIGTSHENPVFLNRNDAGGDRGIWAQEDIFGKWYVQAEEGNYNLRVKFIKEIQAKGKFILELGPYTQQFVNETQTDLIEIENVYIPVFKGDLIPFYQIDGERVFPFWIELERQDVD